MVKRSSSGIKGGIDLTNVGFVGLGKMGMLHLMNIRFIDEVHVIAAADRSKRALKKARSYGVKKLYSSYQDLFADCSELDAVVVSVPNFLHFDVIQSALEADVDIFVEKPLANTTQQCEEIIKSVNKSGKKLMVGHVLRFFSDVQKMKEIADKGHIGNIEVITLERIASGPFSHGIVPKPVPEWWFDPKKVGGGVMLDLGYHLIDLFRFLVGDCKLLYSHLDYKFNLPLEDTAIAVVQSMNSAAKGIIHVGWYEKTIFPQNDSRIIIHGDAGYTSTKHFEPRSIYAHAAKEGIKNLFRKIVGRKIRPLGYAYGYDAFYEELKHFFECVQNDLEPDVSAVDGLKTIELIEEAYRQE